MPQTKISDRIIPALLLTDGLVSILFAISAYSLGFDPNPDWGSSRAILFFIGLVLIGVSIFLFMQKPAFTKLEPIKSITLFGHVWAAIFVIYAFFITFGTFTTWKASTQYYTLLANAFGKGQLHVDVEPGEILLRAKDPYSVEGGRDFNDDVWDLSLYKEKLYLYWGPVPALLLTPVQLIAKTKVTDMYLVYFFLCGLLVFNSLILLKLRQLFFSGFPTRNVILAIFIIGLILPILWSLNVPDVYEAAIGAGQFFLIGGIYFSILAFEGNIRKRYLFFTGLFWACSVGSRAINVLPILFMVALTAFWIQKNQPKPINWNRLTGLAASLLTPLALGAILIGWYNWARFDSPLEFGLRYQITIYNLNRDMPLTFQPDYLPLNFYAYLFQPFEFISNFPFIRSAEIYPLMDALNITPPKLFAGGPVTGILFSMPFLLFALTPFFSKNKAENNTEDKLEAGRFILYLLGGSFLISFVSILVYFYEQTRFMLDMISQITLLAVIGYWMVLSNPRSSKVLLRAANVLITITIAASILLSFTSEGNRMEKLNPALMEKINSFFILQK
jgi:hypothetical protein